MEGGWGALLLIGASALWHERPFPGAPWAKAAATPKPRLKDRTLAEEVG
jgi:hypothetical protein